MDGGFGGGGKVDGWGANGVENRVGGEVEIGRDCILQRWEVGEESGEEYQRRVGGWVWLLGWCGGLWVVVFKVFGGLREEND